MESNIILFYSYYIIEEDIENTILELGLELLFWIRNRSEIRS